MQIYYFVKVKGKVVDNKDFWEILGILFAGIGTFLLGAAAFEGLETWKSIERTKIKNSYLEKLVSSVVQYMGSLNSIMNGLLFVEFSVKQYLNNQDNAIPFEKHAEKLLEKLEAIPQRMLYLTSEGKVLGFKNFSKCNDACIGLDFCHLEIEKTLATISNLKEPHLIGMRKQMCKQLEESNFSTINGRLTRSKEEIINFSREEHETLFLIRGKSIWLKWIVIIVVLSILFFCVRNLPVLTTKLLGIMHGEHTTIEL